MPTQSQPYQAPETAQTELALGTDASALRAEHDLFENVAEGILRTIAEGDQPAVCDAVSALQTNLTAHLDAEERAMIPLYAGHDPDDAARLLEEHAEFRKVLANLDVETDLHLVRAEAVQAFLVALKAHAARENAGLYRWAATRRAAQPV